MKMDAAKRSLAGGEIDPDLHYASDLDPVRFGAAKCRNFIVRAKGGVERTPGTEHLGKAKTSGRVRLAGFVRARAASFLVEYGDHYLRIWNADVAPFAGHEQELDTPWDPATAARLQFAQSNDVQWIFSGGPVKELQRRSGGFDLVDADFKGGPFLDQNLDQDFTLTAGGETGSVSLTASKDLFVADHVGALFRLDEMHTEDAPRWEPEKEVVVGDLRRYNGNTYRCEVAGTTSTVPPTHLLGEAFEDDSSNPKWLYLHSGYGIARITDVAGPRGATAEVVDRLPKQVLDGTTRWREGAWSDVNGYPAAGTLWKSALWAAASELQPFNLWKSAIDGFDDWTPGTEDDSAITRGLYDSNTEAVQWLAPGSYMAIGTEGPEWIARPAESGDTIRVNNLITEVSTDQGSGQIPGRVISGATIFIDASRAALRSMIYDFQNDTWKPRDLSLLAGHILGPGVVEMAYQRTPWPLLWCLLEDGTLGALTYLPEQNVLAWHAHDLGDPVESIMVLPVEGGERETLFAAVRRNGEVHIERMVARYRSDLGQPSSAARYLHALRSFSYAEPVTEISGLDHLEGREVGALVDGNNHPPMTVQNGAVTLNFPGRVVHVGLCYRSCYRTLPYDSGALESFEASRRKRVTDLAIAFRDALGGEVIMADREEIVHHLGDTPLDQAPPLFTGVKQVDPPASDNSGQIEYCNDTAWPATITAIFPEYEV